jgi:hypothetical protein
LSNDKKGECTHLQKHKHRISISQGSNLGAHSAHLSFTSSRCQQACTQAWQLSITQQCLKKYSDAGMKHLVHFSSVVAVVTLHLTHVTDLTVCERVLEVGRNRLAPHGQLANGAHVAMRTEDDDLAGMFGLQALQAVKSQTPPR